MGRYLKMRLLLIVCMLALVVVVGARADCEGCFEKTAENKAFCLYTFGSETPPTGAFSFCLTGTTTQKCPAADEVGTLSAAYDEAGNSLHAVVQIDSSVDCTSHHDFGEELPITNQLLISQTNCNSCISASSETDFGWCDYQLGKGGYCGHPIEVVTCTPLIGIEADGEIDRECGNDGGITPTACSDCIDGRSRFCLYTYNEGGDPDTVSEKGAFSMCIPSSFECPRYQSIGTLTGAYFAASNPLCSEYSATDETACNELEAHSSTALALPLDATDASAVELAVIATCDACVAVVKEGSFGWCSYAGGAYCGYPGTAGTCDPLGGLPESGELLTQCDAGGGANSLSMPHGGVLGAAILAGASLVA